MGFIRNLGLLILLALAAAGGWFVNDAMGKFAELDAYKTQPELTDLPENIRVQILAYQEDIKALTAKLEAEGKSCAEETEEAMARIAALEADNGEYFQKLTACEAKMKAENTPEETTEKPAKTMNKAEDKTETEAKETTVEVQAEGEITTEKSAEDPNVENPGKVIFEPVKGFLKLGEN